ncbi:MAG: DNA polymerase III subunit delta [Myxococcota bacterium]|nr:DNA polymerase III subunit delta [Myxococcota bacterium]
MNPKELSREIAAGKIRPAYLLTGGEALLRDDALATLQQAVLGDGPDDFSLDRLTGENATPASLRDAVGALSMISTRRLVVLRDPEVRKTSPEDAGEALTDTIAELVPELAKQTQTVLVVTTDKVDGRSRWAKAFKDPAASVDCKPLTPGRSVTSFINAEAKRQGLSLEPGAAELLAQRVGPQLLLLRQEIAKAALLADSKQISESDVEASTGQVAETKVWDLTDAVGEGRTAEALGLLSQLLDGGQPPQVLLAILAGHFRKLVRVANGGRLSGHPYVVQKLENQARRYTAARLLACLAAIHDADLHVKGESSMPAEMAVERLVLGLAS